MVKTKRTWFGMAALAAMLLGCVGGEDADQAPDPGGKGVRGEFKGDAIDAANDPARFDPTLERRFDRLPASGEVELTPWPSDYWPTAYDSINRRWDGDQPSPAEKYAQAFDRPEVPAAVSRYAGLQSATPPIPLWFGICEGWAAAAIQELPPLHEVVRNGVTFYPGDIEGLLTLLYARGNVSARFLARRCNDSPARFDEYGRAIAANCLDANPGALHIIVANYVGVRAQSLIEDRVYDAEVWNQPLRSYEILRQAELAEAQAAELVGGPGALGTPETVLPTVTLAQGQQQSGSVVVPAAGVVHFNLSGTGDADLYVNEGAEATLTRFTCRPYTTTSNETCTVRAPAGTVVYWMVNGYSATSEAQLVTTVPSGDATYAFNPAAERFVEVELDLRYVTEASASRTSHAGDAVANAYTRTDRYHYVLELAADGTIIGGEYVGGSRSAHPDFLWLPVGAPAGSVAGVRYDEVRGLLDDSRR